LGPSAFSDASRRLVHPVERYILASGRQQQGDLPGETRSTVAIWKFEKPLLCSLATIAWAPLQKMRPGAAGIGGGGAGIGEGGWNPPPNRSTWAAAPTIEPPTIMTDSARTQQLVDHLTGVSFLLLDCS
jgi:hypothetical protein